MESGDKKTKKMTIQELKEKVFEANLDLVKNGLVIYTWGNVSGIDREKGLVAIMPSGRGIPPPFLRHSDPSCSV